MTLIACLSPELSPVLFSDTLLSSEDGRPEVVLPSVGKMHTQVKGRRNLRTWGYDEKIVVVSDRLMVAWAGDYQAAKSIIEGMGRVFGPVATTMDYIEKYLRANHEAALALVQLIISLREGHRIVTWHHRCEEIVVPPLGAIWLGGSGSARLRQYLHQTSRNLRRDDQPLRLAVATALLLGGTLLADEIATGETLAHHFGGAYDIAAFIKDRATKIDDYCFLFWFGEKDADGVKFNFPQKIMRRYERDGQTCYYCVELDVNTQPFRVLKEEVFIWKQFLAPVAIPHGVDRLPPLNAQWQINAFTFMQSGGAPHIVGQVSRREDRNGHLVSFESSAGKREFAMGFEADQLRQLLLPFAQSRSG